MKNVKDQKPLILKKLTKETVKKENSKFMKKTEIESFYNDMTEICDNVGYSNVDMASEIGELMNKYKLGVYELQEIVDAYPNDINVEHFVKSEIEYELDQEKKVQLFENILSKHGVTDVVSLMEDLKKNGFSLEIT